MTAGNFRKAARMLNQADFVCVGGMYPNSEAESDEQVSWVARFERSNGEGKRPETFWLTPLTLGSPDYAQAVGPLANFSTTQAQ